MAESEKPSSKKSGVDSLREMVRQASLSRLKAHSGFDDLEITAVAGDPLVLAHWMSLVLVSSGIFRMTFSVDFMSSDAKLLASEVLRKRPEKIENSQAFDFIKEYCNLTTGSVKHVIEELEIGVGVSLPLMIRGFDRIYLKAGESAGSISDQWRIRNGKTSLICSILVTIHDEEKFDHLTFDFEEPVEAGQVKFL